MQVLSYNSFAFFLKMWPHVHALVAGHDNFMQSGQLFWQDALFTLAASSSGCLLVSFVEPLLGRDALTSAPTMVLGILHEGQCCASNPRAGFFWHIIFVHIHWIFGSNAASAVFVFVVAPVPRPKLRQQRAS